MTSVEFVIWMRGFMDGARNDEGIGVVRCNVIRDHLGKVDGVPMPREKRTNLRPPVPLLALPEPDAGDTGFVLSQNTEATK